MTPLDISLLYLTLTLTCNHAMIIPTLGITSLLSLYFYVSFLSTKSLVEKLLYLGGNVSWDDRIGWKDQSVNKNAFFLLFWPVSCVSLISLIEI